jgi:SNF2 family DNA or RNA helicase
MKPEERNMEIDSFNSDREAVFLISLRAGGTGLNLTKADIIIHFDPWWNPAVEDQASDRAHRIGQKNVVQVYKLLTEGTIEEKIATLQDKKRNLIESIIKPGENFFNHLSIEEIKELWGIDILHARNEDIN